MTGQKLKDAVGALKVIANGTRFKILCLLARACNESREVCVKDIAEAIGLSHSATSHQLARLEEEGLVRSCRKGQMICYEWSDSPDAKRLYRIMQVFDARL